MQKIALPVIFVCAAASALFYVSQEEHGTGTLALLAAVLLVGQVCATLPFIFDAAKKSRTAAADAAKTASDAVPAPPDNGDAKKILANQQIIQTDLRSLGEALIKRFSTLNDRVSALERNLDKTSAAVAAVPSAISVPTPPPAPDFADDLDDLFEKIKRELSENAETAGTDSEEKLGEKFAALEEKLAASDEKNSEKLAAEIRALAERIDELAETVETLSFSVSPEESDDDESDGEESEADETEVAETESEADSCGNESDGDESDDGNDDAGVHADDDESDETDEAENAETEAPDGTESGDEGDSEEESDADEAESDNSDSDGGNDDDSDGNDEAGEESGDGEDSAESEGAGDEGESDETESDETDGDESFGGLPPACGATLILDAMIGIENKPFLRGNAPGLSESSGVPMNFVEIGRWSYDFEPTNEEITVRVLVNDDENQALGEPVTLSPGQTLEIASDSH